MIKINNLQKKFNLRTIINDFSTQISDGDFISIIGPSGCGKTTLLNLISGIDKTYNGSISVETGINMKYVFQNSILFPWLTLYENVMLPFRVNKSIISSDFINEILDMVGLKEFKDYMPYQLSGGMQRRAVIACALVTSPKLLLLDEPFTGLDFINKQNIMDLFVTILHKCTVIMTTHSVEDALFLSNKIFLFPADGESRIHEINVSLNFPREIDSSFLGYVDLIKKYYINIFHR